MNGRLESVSSDRLQSAVDFLKRVLPEEGFKCAYVVDGDKKYNTFFATVEQLATFALAQDALGKTVYHACSVFRENRKDPKGTPQAQRRLGRTGHNVLGARSLWADVDCGEGKPYATQLDGAEHVTNFIRSSGLPPPVFVGSGNGLHLYFPLEKVLLPEEWRRYAAGLAKLFAAHGLQVDTTRTCDLSSVLRTPGTHHRKSGVKEVIAGPLQGPYPLQLFERLLNGTTLPVLWKDGRTPPLVPARPTSEWLGGIYEERPASAARVARSCRQIHRLWEQPGAVSEPIWHAALGVFAHCDDGRDFAHECSAPEWHGAIDDKLDRLESFGPTTCAKFAGLNAAGCVGCKYAGRITSPVQLGRDDGRSQDDGRDHSEPNGRSPQASPGADGLPKPPPDFCYDSDGRLHHQTGAKNGGTVYELICATRIYLKSIQTAETDGSKFGYLFREKAPRGQWRDIVVTARQAVGREATSELAERGVTIHDGELWRKFVKASVDMCMESSDLEARYDQFGWKKDETAFLLGKKLYTATQVEDATGSPTIEHRSQYLGPSTRKGASLERWRAAANKLFAAGLEYQSLALLCGFAAPLMRFHAEGEGGAIVSFVSDVSGSGKTTALESAASIWGALKGVELDDNDTRVAKGLKLGVLGNLPCVFDELHRRDPELIREFVMLFTNGSDKDRGTTEGTLRINKAEWQTILLVASNISLVDTLSNLDTSDAANSRILEFAVSMPAGVTREDVEEIRRELAFNHGFAGDAFLKKLVQPETVSWIRSNISTWTKAVRKATGLKEEHRFWVRLIVSVIAAGKIIERMKLVDFSLDRVVNWLLDYVRDSAGTMYSAGTREASSVLSDALTGEFLQDTLVVDHAFKPGKLSRIRKEPRRHLVVRHEMEDKRLYISETALKKWLVGKGVNVRNFLDTLRTQGVVLQGVRKITLGAGTDHASGQTPCITVNMNSPLMTGVVATLEEALPEEKPKTRAERIAELDKHAR